MWGESWCTMTMWFSIKKRIYLFMSYSHEFSNMTLVWVISTSNKKQLTIIENILCKKKIINNLYSLKVGNKWSTCFVVMLIMDWKTLQKTRTSSDYVIAVDFEKHPCT